MRTLRFTRTLFGLSPSPFILKEDIQHHLSICRARYPGTVPEIEGGLYVDGLLTRYQTVEKAREVKTNPGRPSGRPLFNFISGIPMSEN